MHLTVMTLDRRTVTVDVADWKTVWDLKVQLCRRRGAFLRPEMQQLLYLGQVLQDHVRLQQYYIDERRYLLMLTKKPPALATKKCTSMEGLNLLKLNQINQERQIIEPKPENSLSVKELIMRLGPWTESDVRRALLISMNNPQRAVEFLVNGTILFPNMVTPPPSVLLLAAKKHDSLAGIKSNENIRKGNVESFKKDKLIKWDLPHCSSYKLNDEETNALLDVDYLIDIGFPRELVIEAYKVCNRNAEETAEFLFQQYRDINIQ